MGAASDEPPPSPPAQPRPGIYTRSSAVPGSSSCTSKDGGDLRASARQREIGRSVLAGSLQPLIAKPTSPVAFETRGSSPPPRKRVVRLSSTPSRGTLSNGLQRTLSAGSLAATSKCVGVDSDGGISEDPDTAEQADGTDEAGSVPLSGKPSKRGDIKFRSSHPRRVAKLSGSLSGPARRGLRIQTDKEAEAQDEEPLTTSQDPASSAAPQRGMSSSETQNLAANSQNTPCQPVQSLQLPNMPVAEAATTTQSTKKRQCMMKVNGRAYTRIGNIGRGGSGKVYRVATARGTMLALKRISVEHADELAEKDLRREIELLRQLRNVERVIQLIDYEMKRERQAYYIVSNTTFYRHFCTLFIGI